MRVVSCHKCLETEVLVGLVCVSPAGGKGGGKRGVFCVIAAAV